MAFVFFDTGATQAANSYFKKVNPAAGNNLTLKLFTNNITPVDTHTAANYTEASGGGYVAKTLTPADFTVSTVGGIVQATCPQQVFSFTGALTSGATIYGALLVDADGVGIGAELAPAAFTPAVAGQIYAVTPVFNITGV